MISKSNKLCARLMCGAGAAAILAFAGQAQAEVRQFDIPSLSLGEALARFGTQSDLTVVTTTELTRAKNSQAISGAVEPEVALAQLLEGTELTWRREGDTFLIVRADDPQSGSAAGDGADGTVEALIVTAQKREEDIQDVPIAISAFTQEQLERSQVAGGPDLMTQVPNMTFTKTNFTSYSIQLRGIGTQAISATTDAAVAVAFNNTPFIRNRFFEQEFYDLQRVEVLRGPQGTLYGRNATAGVVNLISQKPKFAYEAKISGDISNYNSTRLEGMMNVPLVDDMVALRVAGAWTKREGYSTNEITGEPIDGRDLWSTRVSLRFAPTDRFDANLIWEHFEEDDDRLRSGKQLCKKDVVEEFTAVMPDGEVVTIDTDMTSVLWTTSVTQTWQGVQGTFSQGCLPSSLYSPDSFQTPNGISLPFVHPLSTIGVPITSIPYFDPYASTTQSRDLRVIESTVDPGYQAETDVVELQFSADITDGLTITSETGYSSDTIFSTQDYNRFNTASGVFETIDCSGFYCREDLVTAGPNGGVFCDPQIGCADRLVAVDLSTARSRHFSQELRLASSFDGPFNFSLGANFLRYDTEDKYYVFINTLSIYAGLSPLSPGATGGSRGELSPWVAGVSDNVECLKWGFQEPSIYEPQSVSGCVYIDPNPIGNLNDRGHNYFLSKNPYKLISYAVFGETYFNVTDALKVTAGLRWTVDQKEAPRVPSWIIAADTVGYPAVEVVEQEWRKPTGRLTVDWKPDLGFTDETMLYASYAHGYKAGGMNPPANGLVCYYLCGSNELVEGLIEATHPKTFEAEYVDAFELGAKNTMLDGTLTLNTAAFYYDYEGYQISQIVNRAAVNQNFDAKIWGIEIEADWRPLENLKLGFKGGYENTRVADGMMAVDVMDRTAGDPNWVVVRPFPTFPSNCIVPAWLFVADSPFEAGENNLVDVGLRGTGGIGPCELSYVLGLDPVTGLDYEADPDTFNPDLVGYMHEWRTGYPGWDPRTAPNNGAGISKDLSGNELPNAPNFTATITADYTVPLPNDWLATLHTDLYYQSEAWTRIFNTEGYDKLKAYTNVNLAAIFTNEEAGWKVMAYVKNVFDRDSITGSFLNSDDTGLTTNVFLTEPRLYGLRVTKEWTGGPWWTGANPNHTGPYPLTIELGGQVQQHDAPFEPLAFQTFTALAPELQVGDEVQGRDLDWGDGRSVRLTFQPNGSPWKIAAGMRYGRTNGETHRARGERTPFFQVCAVPLAHPFAGLLCDPASPYYNYVPNAAYYSPTEWSDFASRTKEEHTIVDFEVGRDVGVGSFLSSSEIRAGLRYGEFSSRSVFEGASVAAWDVDDGWFKYGLSHGFYRGELTADREFTGLGPALSWDAGAPIWGDERTGRVELEWAATGGALFGEQEVSITGDERSVRRGDVVVSSWPFPEVTDPIEISPSISRSDSVTVPFVDLSMGLSYEIQRVKIGAGYRWERYFDVLDVGHGEAESADRTIDGPYFKLSVGFGG